MRISLYQQHVNKWKDCTRCDLHETRKHVVLARGSIPCDVLFVGEAPGESEDVLGAPFKGPAGKLLDEIVRRAWQEAGVDSELRWAMTNLVACIPRDQDEGGKAAEPEVESIESCAPRLQEFVIITKPKLIVCVGSLARDWLDPKYKGCIKLGGNRVIPRIDIVHPAYILRLNIAQRGLTIQRCVVAVANAIEEYCSEDTDERHTSRGS